jgi:hypothetical protein
MYTSQKKISLDSLQFHIICNKNIFVVFNMYRKIIICSIQAQQQHEQENTTNS